MANSSNTLALANYVTHIYKMRHAIPKHRLDARYRLLLSVSRRTIRGGGALGDMPAWGWVFGRLLWAFLCLGDVPWRGAPFPIKLHSLPLNPFPALTRGLPSRSIASQSR